jgi:hypothetical protein
VLLPDLAGPYPAELGQDVAVELARDLGLGRRPPAATVIRCPLPRQHGHGRRVSALAFRKPSLVPVGGRVLAERDPGNEAFRLVARLLT